MDREKLGRWQRLQGLSALLDGLPTIIDQLGFQSYSFSLSVRGHEFHSSNIASGAAGRNVLAGVLQPAFAHSLKSHFPLLWVAELFADTPGLWDRAQAFGLRHGWIQPAHTDDARSHLAIFRAEVTVSTAQMYKDGIWVIHIGERLHQAAAQLLSGALDSDDPSRAFRHPTADSRCSESDAH